MTNATPKSNSELAADRTALAALRTALAASRSLMAWARTGLSMIGFGFTIYKFLDEVSDQVPVNQARNAGLFLIGLGTVSVLFGCIEYWQFAQEIERDYRIEVRRFPLLMAGAVLLLGVGLLGGALVRIL